MESRYARQEVLPFISKQGQRKLCKARVAIVGCGALGSVAADLLCRAGVGEIILIDHDVVDMTNLQRQALFTEEDVGQPKVSALAAHLKRINGDIRIVAQPQHLDARSLALLSTPDCIVDGTDDIDTRRLINEYAKKTNTPWVYGGAIAQRGFVYAVTKDAPCFECIFPRIKQGESCEEYGIINATSHIIASLQVLECVKVLLGKHATKGLIHFDSSHSSRPKIETFFVKRDPACNVCRGEFSLIHSLLHVKKTAPAVRVRLQKQALQKQAAQAFTIKECKTRAGWSAKPIHPIKLNLAHVKRKFTVVLDTPILLVIRKEAVPGEIIVHNYGEILFKKLDDEKIMRTIAAEIYEAGQ